MWLVVCVSEGTSSSTWCGCFFVSLEFVFVLFFRFASMLLLISVVDLFIGTGKSKQVHDSKPRQSFESSRSPVRVFFSKHLATECYSKDENVFFLLSRDEGTGYRGKSALHV